jgi:hypothetical protein
VIKVFNYIEELDCFEVNSEFSDICDFLGITEWSEVVWIGRYFSLDNDYGEHWFDNWDMRELNEAKAESLGYSPESLLFIDPERMKNDKDGPCHSSVERKLFWTDVCKSLHIGLQTLFAEARLQMEKSKRVNSDFIDNLEERINEIENRYK